MGWSFYDASHYMINGEVDRKAELDNTFSDNYTVVKSSMVGTTYYAAVHCKKTDEVFGYAALTSSDKKGSGYNFGYKGMDETCGPNERKCPLSILRLLTPTDHEYAISWREGCRDYAIARAAERKNPMSFKNLPIGATVLWTCPHERFSAAKKGEQVVLKKIQYRSRAVWYCPAGNWRTKPSNINMDDCVLLERGLLYA